MARLASIQKAGFYATPENLLDYIASLVKPEPKHRYGYRTPAVFDPCAGEGVALKHLTDAWGGRASACEVEKTRYEKLKELGVFLSENADAFQLTWHGACDILYLNPPYDYDKEFKRLEWKWLDRFQHALKQDGLLIFVVPEYVLPACDFSYFHDLSVFRFPPEEYEAYKQVVLVGRKRETPIEAGPLPEPVPLCQEHEPYVVTVDYSRLGLEVKPVDTIKLVENYRPWHDDKGPINGSIVTYERDKQFELACTPKPAYMAAALSSGVFDGHVLRPNDGDLPPILAKGTFKRAFQPIDEKTDKEGVVTGQVEVQRPELRVVALDLNTGEFHELDPSTDAHSDNDLSDFSCGDLIRHYSGDLIKALNTRCTILHDPARDTMELPEFPRKPYTAQAEAIKALLKCLDRDNCAWLMGEIGSGKTTCSLNTALARGARRILVMAPPHLIPVWKDEQIPEIVPHAKVRVLSSTSEIDAWADDTEDIVIGLLSREAAKLGHAWKGVEKCPKCGTDSQRDADKNAKSRYRCKHEERIPKNERAERVKDIKDLLHLKNSILRRELGKIIHKFEEHILPLLYILHFINIDEVTVRFALKLKNKEILRLCKDRDLFERAKAVLTEGESYYSWNDPLEYNSRWGAAIRQEDGSVTYDGVKAGKRMALSAAVSQLERGARWTKKECGEPLYCAIPSPRRYPLAKYMSKKYPDLPDFIILDEAHELANTSSAQSKSAQQLYNLRAPNIAMTGSTMNGYASTLFLPLWFFNEKFRGEFSYKGSNEFIKQYGYIKRIAEDFDSSGDKIEFGSHSNCTRKYRTCGQAPGVLPSLLLKYFLRNTVTMHIEDLGVDLPPCTEHVVRVDLDGEQWSKYKQVEGALVRRIQEDRFGPRMGKLFGQMAMLPSCPDRLTQDTGNNKRGTYKVQYPEGTDLDGENPIVVEVDGLNPLSIMPKEKALKDLVRDENAQGRNVLVLVWNVNDEETGGNSIASRVCHLLNAPYLDSKKVTPKKRVSWIQKNIVSKGRQVLVANPSAIKTGINNLVHFSTIVFYQNPGCSPEIRRQVRGRIVRVGQTKPTKIYTLIYNETAQEYEHKLLLHKVAISEYTDGLDPEAALKASGVGDDTDLIGTDIGKALYKMMERAA